MVDVIAVRRFTLDAVRRDQGDRFELAEDLAAELIAGGLVRDANPRPAPAAEAAPVDTPIGWVGRQKAAAAPVAQPAAAPGPDRKPKTGPRG